jgi:hypothetical protein
MPSVLSEYVGYYQGRSDAAPVYDPGPHSRCLVCSKRLLVSSVAMQVGGLVAKDGSGRHYFFRAHKACWARLNDIERTEYEQSLTDRPVDLPVPVAVQA